MNALPNSDYFADSDVHVPNSDYVDIVSLLVLQFLFVPIYSIYCQLPETDYFAGFIVVQALKRPPLLMIGITLLIGVSRFSRLRWHVLDPSGGTRIFISIVALTVAWQYAASDYNFYYDRTYYVDRFLIIILALVSYYHPIAVPLFTICSLTFASQVNYPLPEAAWQWADKKLLFDVLILFNAFFILTAFKHINRHLFLYLTLCLTGGVYFQAGMAKLMIGPTAVSWLLDNNMANLFVSSYLHGWFGFLDSNHVVTVSEQLAWLNVPLALCTLVVELGAGLILLSRNASRLVLASLILLHVGIAVLSGILFWMWAVYDFGLIVFVNRAHAREGGYIFQPKLFVLSVTIIVLSAFVFRTIPFAWFDTKLTNIFSVYGQGVSDKFYKLQPYFFAPYDMTFSQSRFYYATQQKVLVGTYGTSQDYKLARALERALPADVESLRQRYGVSRYDKQLKDQLARFLRRFVNNAQRRRSKLVINYLAPPYHFGSVTVNNAYEFQERLTRLIVVYEERLFTGHDWIMLKRTAIMEVALSEDADDWKVDHSAAR
jgi:hypothetical protein